MYDLRIFHSPSIEIMHAYNIKLVQVVLQTCTAMIQIKKKRGIRILHGTHIEICHANNVKLVQVILQACKPNAPENNNYKILKHIKMERTRLHI